MHMTNAQLLTFRDNIAANTNTINGVQIKDLPQNGDTAFAVAAWYGGLAAEYYVWRKSVPETDILADPAFDFTRVDNLSVGKDRVWTFMFRSGSINPNIANIRAGIATVWVGTAQDLAVRAVVLAVCAKKASHFEKLFCTATPGGAGNRGILTNPDLLGIGAHSDLLESPIDGSHVQEAWEAV